MFLIKILDRLNVVCGVIIHHSGESGVASVMINISYFDDSLSWGMRVRPHHHTDH